MKSFLSISLFILSLGTAQILGDDFYKVQSNEFCSMQNRAIESNRFESLQNPPWQFLFLYINFAGTF